MTVQPPPPPSITPRQMNLLRIVTAMAWADGELAQEEVDLMLDRFSRLFAGTPEQQQSLQQELRDYMLQNIPLEESIPKLETQEEKALVLQLGYETIAASARTPDEPNINTEEAEAYQSLVNLLDLPPETVKQVESNVESGASSAEELIDRLAAKLKAFIGG